MKKSVRLAYMSDSLVWYVKAFKRLKDAIISEPVLIMYDPKRPIKLEADASDYAIGA